MDVLGRQMIYFWGTTVGTQVSASRCYIIVFSGDLLVATGSTGLVWLEIDGFH